MSKLLRFMLPKEVVEVAFFAAGGGRLKSPVLAGKMPPGRKLWSGPALRARWW